MKRRSVLGGLGTLAGTSLAGCLGGSNKKKGGKTSATPPWYRKTTMDVSDDGTTGRLVIHISQKADISEVNWYTPKGQLINTAVVGESQRQVGIAQLRVSTRPISFYGFDPGTYKVSALVGGEKTEKQPVEVVREFAMTNLSLRYRSEGGKEWVSGFKASVTNDGLYPYILMNMGPVDGVPNPPAEGTPGSAEPVAEDGDAIVWWNKTEQFVEDRGEALGPLVKPKEKGTPADGELSGEFTTTLRFVTTKRTHDIPVTYRLEGQLVDTGDGWAMSGGRIVSVGGEKTTPTGTSTATDGG